MAVGKMSVGRELAKQLNFKFFHNHQSIELALEYFEFGSPGFNSINQTIREVIFKEVAKHETKGFVLTFVMALNEEDDPKYVQDMTSAFLDFNPEWDVYYVELSADLQTRIERNKHPERIKHKPSKSNVEVTEQRMLGYVEKYVMNSTEEYPFPFDVNRDHYIKIDNSNLSIKNTVDKIVKHFRL